MDIQQQLLALLHETLAKKQLKNPRFSKRNFANQLSIYPSTLSDILNGKRRITYRMGKKIIEYFDLSGPERKKLLQGLIGIDQDHFVKRDDFVELDQEIFHVVSDWFYFAILSLTEIDEFKSDTAWISERLNVPQTEIEIAIDRLLDLNMLKRLENGRFVATGVQYRSSDDIVNKALCQQHYQNLELSRNSLKRDHLDKRDISSMTMAINRKKLIEAKHMIKQFRRNFMKVMEVGPKDDVYKLNVQFVPITKQEV